MELLHGAPIGGEEAELLKQQLDNRQLQDKKVDPGADRNRADAT